MSTSLDPRLDRKGYKVNDANELVRVEKVVRDIMQEVRGGTASQALMDQFVAFVDEDRL